MYKMCARKVRVKLKREKMLSPRPTRGGKEKTRQESVSNELKVCGNEKH